MNISTRRDKELLNLVFEGEHLDYLAKKSIEWISSYMNRHPVHIQLRHTSEFRINRYVTGTSMSEHSDNIVSLFEKGSGSPLLSIVGCLNDDYEGGETYFPEQNIKYTPEAGHLIMFPSDLTHPHGVTEVIKGDRYTLPIWFTDDETKLEI